jgi:hypothetical protein
VIELEFSASGSLPEPEARGPRGGGRMLAPAAVL